MNRRNFLRGLLALPLAGPTLSLLAPRKSATIFREYGFSQRGAFRWSTSEVIASTIESRSRQIADNVSKNNALLAALRRRA